jgi:hypothetical protein
MKGAQLKSSILLAVVFLSACATRHPDVPGPAAGSVVWLRADVGVTGDRDNVASWADQSGNGNNATMTNTSRQPSLVPRAINGQPAIHFDGAQSLLLTTPVSPQTFTIFVVGNNNKPGEDFSMILGPGGNSPNNQLRWEGDCHVLFVGTGNEMSAERVAFGDTRNPHILALRYQGSIMQIYRDGQVVAQRSVSTSGPWTLNQIGAWYSQHFLVGNIAELLIYPAPLSDTALAQTTTYLRIKYLEPSMDPEAQYAPPDIGPECPTEEIPAR